MCHYLDDSPFSSAQADHCMVLNRDYGYGCQKNVAEASVKVVPTWVGARNLQSVTFLVLSTTEGISYKALMEEKTN